MDKAGYGPFRGRRTSAQPRAQPPKPQPSGLQSIEIREILRPPGRALVAHQVLTRNEANRHAGIVATHRIARHLVPGKSVDRCQDVDAAPPTT